VFALTSEIRVVFIDQSDFQRLGASWAPLNICFIARAGVNGCVVRAGLSSAEVRRATEPGGHSQEAVRGALLCNPIRAEVERRAFVSRF
jgi:hypothetical protein